MGVAMLKLLAQTNVGFHRGERMFSNTWRKSAHRIPIMQCEYCGTRGKYKDITTQHYAECSKLPLPCPKGCPAVVKRADFRAHKNECPSEEVACQYSEAGCDVIVLRKDTDNHLLQNYNQHLMMIVHPFLQLRDKFDALSARVIEMSTTLEASERQMCEKLANTNARVEETSGRVGETSARVKRTKTRVDETNVRVKKNNAKVEETDARLTNGA